jgi:hypothetical protein
MVGNAYIDYTEIFGILYLILAKYCIEEEPYGETQGHLFEGHIQQRWKF